eukprot:876812-Prymnesium_polylepis.2
MCIRDSSGMLSPPQLLDFVRDLCAGAPHVERAARGLFETWPCSVSLEQFTEQFGTASAGERFLQSEALSLQALLQGFRSVASRQRRVVFDGRSELSTPYEALGGDSRAVSTSEHTGHAVNPEVRAETLPPPHLTHHRCRRPTSHTTVAAAPSHTPPLPPPHLTHHRCHRPTPLTPAHSPPAPLAAAARPGGACAWRLARAARRAAWQRGLRPGVGHHRSRRATRLARSGRPWADVGPDPRECECAAVPTAGAAAIRRQRGGASGRALDARGGV